MCVVQVSMLHMCCAGFQCYVCVVQVFNGVCNVQVYNVMYVLCRFSFLCVAVQVFIVV